MAVPDALYRAALSASGQAMALVSLEGCVLAANPALARMLGHEPDALAGLSLDDVGLGGEGTGALATGLAGTRPGTRSETHYRDAAGQVRHGEVTLDLVHDDDGQPAALVLHLREVGAERSAHDALARELAGCRADLAALDRHLEGLAFGISHDLRTPLRTIDSFATRLAQRHGAQLDAEARDHLQRIRSAAAGMGGLIEGLLEWSRASRAPLRPGPVNLSLLAEWAGAEVQEREPDVPLQLQVQPGLGLQGDERLLKLALQHLFDNAWKFSRMRDPQAPVRIEVGGHRDPAGLQLWVRDWGSGFDMQYAQRVFEPFKRAHSVEDGAGHGLGLAIAQRVVERHGGRIGAESVPGMGSTFRIVLPDAGVPA
jgi:PAS domain S-box-containing protein